MRHELVLWVDDPEPIFLDAAELGRDIKSLVEDFTMGRVTVTPEPAGDRVAELEGILGGQTDDWEEAKARVEDLVRAFNFNGDVGPVIHALRQQFGIDEEVTGS